MTVRHPRFERWILLAGLTLLVACATGDSDDDSTNETDDADPGDDDAPDDGTGDDSTDDTEGDDDNNNTVIDIDDDLEDDDDTGAACEHDADFISETAKVHLIDVEQGEAIYVQTQWDYNILIGAGADDPADRLIRYLRNAGVVRLQELVMASVLEEDIGEMPDVLAEFPVDLLRKTPAQSDSEAYAAVMKGAAERGIPVVTSAAGDVLHWLGDPELILGPPYPFPPDYTDRDKALVIRFSIGRRDILLAGSITARAETEILRTFGPAVCVEGLKVAHHGDRDATSDAFLDAMDPDQAAAIAGQGNPDGFPHAETVARLLSRGIVFGYTGVQGPMVWQSDGWDLWFCEG